MESGCTVTGFDPDGERGDALADIGGAVAKSREDACLDADAVVIATPPAFHLDDLKAAIDLGLHAYVEKPIAHSDRGLDSMLGKAEGSGLVVFTGLNLRYHAVVRRAAEMVRNGMTGPTIWARFNVSTYLPDYRPWQDYRKGYAADPVSGGVIFDSIHELDLATHILGQGEVVAAMAWNSGTLDIEAEDCAEILMRHEDGFCSSVHLDFASPNRRRYFEIAGENGFFFGDIDSGTVQFTANDGDMSVNETMTEGYDESYVRALTEFLRLISSPESSVDMGRDGVGVLRQALKARQLAGLP